MRVTVDPLLCQLLVLHNVSGQHYSAIRCFGQHWASSPAPLSPAEQRALGTWQALERAHARGHDTLVFEALLAGRASGVTGAALRRCARAFARRTAFHARAQAGQLRRVASFLRSVPLGDVAAQTGRIYGCRVALPRIAVTLSHGANREAGGMLLGDVAILQFGDYELRGRSEELLSTLFHEVTHDCSVRAVLPRGVRIRTAPSFPGSASAYVDEVLQQALWGQIGVLSQAYFSLTDAELHRRERALLRARTEPLRTLARDAATLRRLIAQALASDSGWHVTRPVLRSMLSAAGILAPATARISARAR